MATDQAGDQIPQIVTEETLIRDAALQAECCVICLDTSPDLREQLPCRHRSFHTSCLKTWLAEKPSCPLCKASVPYELLCSGEDDLRKIPPARKQGPREDEAPVLPSSRSPRAVLVGQTPPGLAVDYDYAGQSHSNPPRDRERPSSQVLATRREALTLLRFRKGLYRHMQFSKAVRTNPYRELSPTDFCNDHRLLSRARTFVERELRVFPFLVDPDHQPEAIPIAVSTSREGGAETAGAAHPRRHRQPLVIARFLTEYVLLILKSIGASDRLRSAGLLAEYLGREEAKLFVHELEAWLRSPHEKLQEWDKVTQYPLPGVRGLVSNESIIYPDIRLSHHDDETWRTSRGKQHCRRWHQNDRQS